MIRKIITIDSERCNGCGLCAAACHEGAIGMVNGKAVLLREDYCDGLGDCLPACPTGAITMTEREAPAYDEAAVAAHLAARKPAGGCAGGGCPGSRSQTFAAPAAEALPAETCLGQWPVQLRLVSPMAGFFDGADLLLAADPGADGSALLRRSGAGGTEGAGCLRTPDSLRKRHPFGTGRDPLIKKEPQGSFFAGTGKDSAMQPGAFGL